RDGFPVVQRRDGQFAPAVGAELEDGDGFVDTAQEALGLAEHLHRDAGAMAVLAQQLARPDEVLVRVVALPHAAHGKMKNGGVQSRLAGHQVHSSSMRYRTTRCCIHRTANASASARKTRFHMPYLVVPKRRGRWFTGTSATVPPSILTRVG